RAVARRVPLGAFAPDTPQRRLVEALLDPDARLLVSDAGANDNPTVRIAHEALVTRWTTAREFVEANAAALKVRRRLEERYALWRRLADVEAEHPPSKSKRMTFESLRRWRPEGDREQGLLTEIDLTDGLRLLADHAAE